MDGELAWLMEGLHGWQLVKLPSVSDIVVRSSCFALKAKGAANSSGGALVDLQHSTN